ncbi:hypothetical protein CASFOL_029298 [Castilleja foliolosa]|uniref:Uncharacterized protein n=1 Tax=Castilleja foliolosa TaxID=1961234 RepID=A0ABD3CAL8_9LAMI
MTRFLSSPNLDYMSRVLSLAQSRRKIHFQSPSIYVPMKNFFRGSWLRTDTTKSRPSLRFVVASAPMMSVNSLTTI